MVEKQKKQECLDIYPCKHRDIIYVEVRTWGKRVKEKKKPSTADSSGGQQARRVVKRGRRGRKKKKEAEPEHYEFLKSLSGQKPWLREFYHGETDREKFETTKLFRSYKMPVGHTVPNLQQQHVNIRNMHLRRFPELRLSAVQTT